MAALSNLHTIQLVVSNPTLSGPAVSNVQPTTFTASVTTNASAGTLYVVATSLSIPPNPQQIIAGLDALDTPMPTAWRGSQSILSTGLKNFPLTGFVPGTIRYAHFVHTNGVAVSNVVSVEVTLAPGAAPSWSVVGGTVISVSRAQAFPQFPLSNVSALVVDPDDLVTALNVVNAGFSGVTYDAANDRLVVQSDPGADGIDSINLRLTYPGGTVDSPGINLVVSTPISTLNWDFETNFPSTPNILSWLPSNSDAGVNPSDVYETTQKFLGLRSWKPQLTFNVGLTGYRNEVDLVKEGLDPCVLGVDLWFAFALYLPSAQWTVPLTVAGNWSMNFARVEAPAGQSNLPPDARDWFTLQAHDRTATMRLILRGDARPDFPVGGTYQRSTTFGLGALLLNQWVTYVVNAKFHWDVAQVPYFKLWKNGVLTINDAGINATNFQGQGGGFRLGMLSAAYKLGPQSNLQAPLTRFAYIDSFNGDRDATLAEIAPTRRLPGFAEVEASVRLFSGLPAGLTYSAGDIYQQNGPVSPANAGSVQVLPNGQVIFDFTPPKVVATVPMCVHFASGSGGEDGFGNTFYNIVFTP